MSGMRIKLTYTAAEYDELKGQLDKAIDDLARHAQELVELRNDKAMLLQQIERAVDEQKVELPREVAEAIESCRGAGMSNISIIKALDVIPQLFRDYDSSVLEALNVISGYSKKLFCTDRLLITLVNGYTIEQTNKERLREKLREAYNVWAASPSNGPDNFEQDQNELFDLITDAVEQIYQTETMT